ncbi:MAG: hypothetical protein KFH98_10185 [Gemmatimonadetes bacterium]|nr:hypothetical protein [Gemmatimonadota bacterium]
MRRILKVGPGVWVLAALVAACGDEGPTAVGSDLMGPGVRTYEVILEPADYLVADTTFDRLGSMNDALFRMAAHQFEDDLEARTLFSVTRPITVTYSPEEGQTATDTIQALRGGIVTIVLDTIASSPGPVDVEVVQVTEEWYGPSATWDTRIDTTGVSLAWTTPGGSPGAVLGGATWTAGDTLRITLDSAAVAVWDDTLAAAMGGMIRSTTPGSRVFIESLAFAFEAVPATMDTIVPAGSMRTSKIILTPEDLAPGAGMLRVGGLPAWRSLLRFQPMADVRIPCGPGSPAACRLPLDSVTINQAALLLAPLPAGPRRLERPGWVEGRGVLEGPNVPLMRSPLTPPVGPPSDTLTAAQFVDSGADVPAISLSITSYVRFHLDPPAGENPPSWLAITAIGERSGFGYAAFGGLASPRPPRLRLVVSVTDAGLVR